MLHELLEPEERKSNMTKIAILLLLIIRKVLSKLIILIVKAKDDGKNGLKFTITNH